MIKKKKKLVISATLFKMWSS